MVNYSKEEPVLFYSSYQALYTLLRYSPGSPSFWVLCSLLHIAHGNNRLGVAPCTLGSCWHTWCLSLAGDKAVIER